MIEEDQNLLQTNQNQPEQRTPRKTTLIYSWGRNDDGQLGIPNTKTANYPSAIRGFKNYARQIATAHSHTAILNEKGQIYLAGSLLFGKIGISSQINNFRQFKLHQQMSQYVVKKVACGDYHTLALIDDGTVFSWGGTLWDKTGNKVVAGTISRIQKLVGQHVVDIACGDFHSVALNSTGGVYSWGGGGQNKNKGQLGHSNKKDLPHPEMIAFFKDKKVAKIACGYYFTMILTVSGDLYAFGEGGRGQLGTGSKEDSATPKKVKLNYQLSLDEHFRTDINQQTRIEQIALGGHHSLLLTNKGHVYACGYGSQGQLGLGHGNTDNKYEPTLIKVLFGKQIVMIAAGASHSLALSSKHDVFCCGYNGKGQLGIGEEKSVTIWTHVSQLQGKNVGEIYAGGDHSWAVVDQVSPFIKDYEPPSPIKVSFDEATIIRPNENSRPQRSAFSNNSMDQILDSLTPNRKLQLIISETDMSHRFIHLVTKEIYPNFKKKLQNYISYLQENDRGLKHYRITQDQQMVDAKKKIILPANPKGYTVMLVAEVDSHATQYLNANVKGNKTSIGIGEMFMMDSAMLKTQNGKIPNHNLWFFKFHQIFDDSVEKARFIELRPKFA